MRNLTRVALAVLVAAFSWSCDDHETTDTGGVTIAYGTLTGFPSQVAVNSELADGELALGSIVLRSIPTGNPGDFSDIQIQSYEVTYTRADGGTRVPPPLVRFYTGNLPTGGTFTANGVTILGVDQIFSPPINDLFFINGGLDRETSRTRIILNYHLRFFGRTLSGREIESPVLRETIELVP